jgi:hypothetical protein
LLQLVESHQRFVDGEQHFVDAVQQIVESNQRFVGTDNVSDTLKVSNTSFTLYFVEHKQYFALKYPIRIAPSVKNEVTHCFDKDGKGVKTIISPNAFSIISNLTISKTISPSKS